MKKSLYVRLGLAGLIVAVALAAAIAGPKAPAGGVAAFLERPTRGGYTLIIDPGHGGADGGAVSVTGTPESRLNLAIGLKIRELAAFFGVDTLMTRESEDIAYPEDAGTIRAKKVWDTKGRAEYINGVDNGFLISIHQNKFTSAKPSGSQVFYAPTDKSREAADIFQSKLRELAPGNRQNATQIPDSVYIMNHISCPAVLIECGFVSNAVEAKRLEDPEYQTALAATVIGAYLESVS